MLGQVCKCKSDEVFIRAARAVVVSYFSVLYQMGERTIQNRSDTKRNGSWRSSIFEGLAMEKRVFGFLVLAGCISSLTGCARVSEGLC